MKYLIINAGSTSVKYSLYNGDSLEQEEKFDRKQSGFLQKEKNFIRNSGVDYFLFRIVHGLDLRKTSIIDDYVYSKIKEGMIFAPLHNKYALEIIDFVNLEFGNDRAIAVFDTEFHKNIPDKAKIYPIPSELSKKHKIVKYGFHGLAFESALQKCKKELGYLPENIIAMQAGGGVSVCAIKNGVSIDTSMGATPTDGIMMLTRSGSVDPEIVRILEQKENLLPSEVSKLLNFDSGFLGLTGSKDTKEIIERAKRGDEKCKLAYDIFLYEIKKTIFAYAGVLGGVDLILLSGGLAFNNEYFADDLYKEVKHLPVRKDQILKVNIDENEIILKKAKELLSGSKIDTDN